MGSMCLLCWRQICVQEMGCIMNGSVTCQRIQVLPECVYRHTRTVSLTAECSSTDAYCSSVLCMYVCHTRRRMSGLNASVSYLFEGHPLVLQHLVPALLNLYTG